MRRLVSLLALAPVVAFAASPAVLVEGPATEQIAEAVSVPLLRSGDRPLPTVQGSVTAEGDDAKDEPVMVVIDLAGSGTRISSGTAKALGVKVKEKELAKGWKAKLAVVPKITIGGMVLTDVPVQVVGDDDVVLGCAALNDVACAILPSQGVVKFVPVGSAAALLAEVGAPVTESRLPKTFFEHGEKKYGSHAAPMFPGVVAGHDGLVTVHTARIETWADPFDAKVGVRTETAHGAPTLNGVALAATTIDRRGDIVDPDDKLVGRIGWGALHTADLAYDPASGQLAVKLATGSKAESLEKARLDLAKKDYEDANKPAEPAAEGDEKPAKEDPDDVKVGKGDAGDSKKVGIESSVAPAYESAAFAISGAATDALAHYKAAADAAGDNCAPHQAYGNALITLAGDAKSALPELRRAAEGYDAWRAQDKDLRATISKGKNEDAEAYIIEQPSSCHTAWGDLAGAHLALDEHAEIAKIYAEHMALNTDLALIYGFSQLRQGKAADAVGPIRQAIEMDQRNGAEARVALAMAGEAAAWSEAGLDRLVVAGATEQLHTLTPFVEAARAKAGNAEALRVARYFTAQDPAAAPAWLLLAREVPAAERADVLAKAKAAIAGDVAYRGVTVNNAAWSALYDAIDGRLAPMAQIAQDGKGQPEVETAAAIAARDDGDLAAAKAHRKALREHLPLTPMMGIEATGLDTRLPGLPGSPRPPKEAPAPVYTSGCAEVAPATFGALAGSWSAAGAGHLAFKDDRWCAWDDAGVLTGRGAAGGWSVLSCPGTAPTDFAAAPQETWLVLRDANALGAQTCNRFIAVDGQMGTYAQSCVGEAPFSSYGARAMFGQWAQDATVAPDACWADAPVAPEPGKKGGK